MFGMCTKILQTINNVCKLFNIANHLAAAKCVVYIHSKMARSIALSNIK